MAVLLARPAPGSRPARAGALEQDLHVCQSERLCAVARGRFRVRIGQQAAQLDHLPGERVPVPPCLLCLRRQHAAHDFRHVGENLRHAPRHVVVAQNVPFREPAHDRRAQRINHPADPGLANAIGAHRARLDIGIKRVVAKLLPADRLLRLRERDDLGVTGHVAVPDGVVDGLRQDLSVARDHRAERIFALAHRDARQRDATRHHRLVSLSRNESMAAVLYLLHATNPASGGRSISGTLQITTGNIIPFAIHSIKIRVQAS